MIQRHQFDIFEPKQKIPLKPTQAEKMTLAVLTHKLKLMTNRTSNQLHHALRIFQSATVLKWHRELVRRKWTAEHKNRGGVPKLARTWRGSLFIWPMRIHVGGMARLRANCSNWASKFPKRRFAISLIETALYRRPFVTVPVVGDS